MTGAEPGSFGCRAWLIATSIIVSALAVRQTMSDYHVDKSYAPAVFAIASSAGAIVCLLLERRRESLGFVSILLALLSNFIGAYAAIAHTRWFIA